MFDVLSTLGRAANRLKREVMLRPPLRGVVEARHRQALRRHAARLPSLAEDARRVVDALRSQLIVQIPLADLAVPGSDAMLAQLERDAQTLAAAPCVGRMSVSLPPAHYFEHPAPYLWGLDERLLDLVEHVIGLPVHYHGVDLRRELADGSTHDVRQWHCDPEDFRMVKLIAYLDHDVGADDGAFEYLGPEDSARARRALHYVSGFVSDARMNAVVPRSAWRRAVGPRHTANLVDTCGLFHRASPPTRRDRYTVTWSWLSRSAMKTYPVPPMDGSTCARWVRTLSQRQRDCIPLHVL